MNCDDCEEEYCDGCPLNDFCDVCEADSCDGCEFLEEYDEY